MSDREKKWPRRRKGGDTEPRKPDGDAGDERSNVVPFRRPQAPPPERGPPPSAA